jgi:2-oxoglutarate dehydrogenase E2 component (dihydrolipoamide succinyltransferase)
MEIKIPEFGESIFEAVIASWNKQDGDRVAKDELLCELETDKINVELHAEGSGILSIRKAAGSTVKVGSVIGTITASAAGKESKSEGAKPTKEKPPKEENPAKEVKAEPEPTREKGRAAPGRAAPPVNPAARKLAREEGIKLDAVTGSGKEGRVLVEDVQQAKAAPPAKPVPAPKSGEGKGVAAPAEEQRLSREPMSPLRKRIAERLVAVRQSTAMLTTFSEADMSRVMELRRRQQEHFSARHGIKLGLMSFFVKASVEALKEFPLVNARIDGDDIVHQHFYDIGIAVASERGLVVPVLRAADRLSFAAIEEGIAALAEKVRTRKIALADLDGGTFTITNGGIFGSLLSTPMLNPPQCGILGMHAILDRPVARDGAVVIRPMMNLALSYDHRLIDGKEAVSFLQRIKACIEDPEELLLEQ